MLQKRENHPTTIANKTLITKQPNHLYVHYTTRTHCITVTSLLPHHNWLTFVRTSHVAPPNVPRPIKVAQEQSRVFLPQIIVGYQVFGDKLSGPRNSEAGFVKLLLFHVSQLSNDVVVVVFCCFLFFSTCSCFKQF